MKVIIRDATIVDAQSSFNNATIDIAVADGLITDIGPKLKNNDGWDEIRRENLHISQGWFDSSVSFGEPGFEERETLANGLIVAARSGFTDIALQPNTFPVIDNQSQIGFVKSKAVNSAVNIHPIGALTTGSHGTDLAELFDMKRAGAVAFGDYNKDIANANLLKIALQYTQDFDGLVIAYSQDENLSRKGVANEGTASTRLGLKGIPALAEALQIARNLYLLEYTGGRMHIPTISTARSVKLIKDAKKKGLNVTCSVAVHHLVLTDDVLDGFDTRYKVMPPLRSEQDRQALIKGVQEGTIDMITSDHNPIDIEHKKMEFDFALSGTIGLESAFGALLTVLPLETVIQKLTFAREFFGIGSNSFTKGSQACFTMFDTATKATFSKAGILSKSKNSALLGYKTTGRVYGIFNNNQLIIQE